MAIVLVLSNSISTSSQLSPVLLDSCVASPSAVRILAHLETVKQGTEECAKECYKECAKECVKEYSEEEQGCQETTHYKSDVSRDIVPDKDPLSDWIARLTRKVNHPLSRQFQACNDLNWYFN